MFKVVAARRACSGLKADAVAAAGRSARVLLLVFCASLLGGSALLELCGSRPATAAAAQPNAARSEAWFKRHSRKDCLKWAASGTSSSSSCLPHHAYTDRSSRSLNSSRKPFNASQFETAEQLLLAHRQWQAQVLDEAMQAAAAGRPFVPPKAVLLKPYPSGWGNRLLPIATGMMIAMFTDRVFLMKHESNITDYLDFHWDLDFSKYTALYSDACACSISDLNRLTHPSLDFCRNSSECSESAVFSNAANVTLLEYTSYDYDMPLLQVNPALQATLQKLFPGGNIFHEVATRLFSFSQLVQRTAAQYVPLADQCRVGIQMRYRKQEHKAKPVPIKDFTTQVAGIAKSAAGGASGNVFVAADVAVYDHLAALLPGRTVWWSNESQASITNDNKLGNPGSNLSAFVDIYLLTKCKQLVCTASSTFGSVAAAYADVAPVYAIKAPHDKPFYKPYFWKGLTSEPQMYKAGRRFRNELSEANVALLAAHHTYWVQLQQWHF